MGNNHLLTDIEIKDFKCFKDFKANGFKRVNLIGGMNNVGKTAFMEACYINVHSQDINSSYRSLYRVQARRDFINLVAEVYTQDQVINHFESMKLHSSESNINKIEYHLLNTEGEKEYSFNLNNQIKVINANNFSYESKRIENIIFIDNVGMTNIALKTTFEDVQTKDKETVLYSYINRFDNNIINFKFLGGDKPSCKVKDRNEYQLLNDFGDGLKHYISIICSLYSCENGYLFIDEIDNGIHYTQLDRLWEIILTISKEQNVQVFATTHSKEMIESFARVSKRFEDKDISYIKMSKLDDNSIKVGIRDYDMLQDSMEENHEVRGW